MAATSKTTKTKPVMDVSRPAKDVPPSEKLVIESRPLINHDETPAPDAGSDIEVKTNQSQAEAADTTQPEPSAKVAAMPSTTKKVLTPPTLSTPETAGAPDTATPADEPKAPSDAEAKPEEDAPAATDADLSPAEESTKVQRDKDAEETKKAVEQARRDQEVKQYIENKQFFVPINEVARKRSIKVSFGLVLLMAFLAAVLIDLMLDSGIILLLQKIPHTNFFST